MLSESLIFFKPKKKKTSRKKKETELYTLSTEATIHIISHRGTTKLVKN